MNNIYLTVSIRKDPCAKRPGCSLYLSATAGRLLGDIEYINLEMDKPAMLIVVTPAESGKKARQYHNSGYYINDNGFVHGNNLKHGYYQGYFSDGKLYFPLKAHVTDKKRLKGMRISIRESSGYDGYRVCIFRDTLAKLGNPKSVTMFLEGDNLVFRPGKEYRICKHQDNGLVCCTRFMREIRPVLGVYEGKVIDGAFVVPIRREGNHGAI